MITAKELKSGIYTVEFNKVDGTPRSMRCTLLEQYLPEKAEFESTRKVNDEVLAVWDLDKQSWRSFRLDTVTFVKKES